MNIVKQEYKQMMTMQPFPKSREDLLNHIERGFEPSYLFFWGHTSLPGKVAKTCFSQWYPSPFTIDGETFLTAEHYMMASKAQLFNDADTRKLIMSTASPAEAKKLGRQVKNFDVKIWNDVCRQIVVDGNHAKFSQNIELASFLVGTGNDVLVEASPYDPIWGIGLGENDPAAQDPKTWKGSNLLGFALMEVRHQLCL